MRSLVSSWINLSEDGKIFLVSAFLWHKRIGCLKWDKCLKLNAKGFERSREAVWCRFSLLVCFSSLLLLETGMRRPYKELYWKYFLISSIIRCSHGKHNTRSPVCDSWRANKIGCLLHGLKNNGRESSTKIRCDPWDTWSYSCVLLQNVIRFSEYRKEKRGRGVNV